MSPAQLRIEGTYTALVTPFRDGPTQPVDWEALDALVDAQVAAGVAGLVPCGTTGESPTLSHEEHAQVVERTVQRADKRTQVMAGAGSNSTREAIGLAQHAERAGADAIMVVVPYYNKPTPAGLFRHFVEVAGSVRLPVVLYNIPARTGIDLLPDTLERICAEAPNVVGVKEATGNVLRAQKLAQTMGDRLAVLSGDDSLSLPMIAVGARGVISVTSNILPALVARATRLALEGKLDEARRAHLALMPVHEAMFLEANPGPVKAALAARGAMKATVRLPLVPVEETTRAAVVAAVSAAESTVRASR
ncbi:MAG: 4-hydroxy-tetrahydrodipicolinate synthase [Polyangiaceae bacterium]